MNRNTMTTVHHVYKYNEKQAANQGQTAYTPAVTERKNSCVNASMPMNFFGVGPMTDEFDY
ncbi:MAG: hypothetical protein JXO44_00580 [Clostridia bacterium]|nr:hypothetical protein [Clostridia bacterium]